MSKSPLLAALIVAVFSTFSLTGCDSLPNTTRGGKDFLTNSDSSTAQKRARLRLELATAYYSQGKLEPALDEVKQSIAIDPNLADAFNLRGLIYDALGDDVLAEASYHRALQIDSKSAPTLHNYGWFMCQRKRYDAADKLFVEALAIPQYRDASQTFFVRGVCLGRQGKFDSAESALMRAYELDAGNPSVAVNLADVLYKRREYERARFYIRRVNNSPDLSNSESLWLAIKIEHQLQNRQGVLEYGNQLRSRFPSSAEALAFEAKRFDE